MNLASIVSIIFGIVFVCGTIAWYISHVTKNSTLNKIAGWSTIASFIALTVIGTLYLTKKISFE